MIPHSIRMILIRHGQTDWNAEGRLQGRQNVPLNGVGREQARCNGLALKALADREGLRLERFDWVSSPLGRTRETMEIVRGVLGMDPSAYRTDEQLIEISFGDWEGSTLPEVESRDRVAHAARQTDKWAYVPPGGESYEMLSERVRAWLRSREHDTICVCHGGIIRAVRGLVLGVPVDEVPVFPVPQDHFAVIEGGRETWHAGVPATAI
ncbi:histidine phosphatase family protein [Lutibaculum baratangense]|uniref:Phosphoglycerate mutase family (Rhiz) n=1 Tax=Lutibaculum baratangense AMV1 TaxID=631454 RepID=V4RF10_9HYPH|nr:histidine phosphatase family protein [Lutibaculum baratangense]ESR24741.1 Phosphoglycerate mutase family (Rhiz) [Lutibaculum baratangense AMV1]